MIAVPTALFLCLYGLLYFSAKGDQTNYSEEVVGAWTGIQYYQGGQKTVCGSGHPVTADITPECISISAENFPLDAAPYSWRGRTMVFTTDGEETAAAVSFDSQGYLKLDIQAWDLTLTLRRTQTEGDADAD